MERTYNCFYCKRDSIEMLITNSYEEICPQCLSKLILFNQSNFYENCKPDIYLNCLRYPNMKMKTKREKIWNVLSKLQYHNASDEKECEYHNLKEDIFCKECNRNMCEKCFIEHKQVAIFSMHQKGPKPSKLTEKCTTHHSVDIQYQCLECEFPICEVCKSTEHQTHTLELMNKFRLKMIEELPGKIKTPFENYEELDEEIKINENETIISVNQQVVKLVDYIENTMQNLTNTLTKNIIENISKINEGAKMNNNIIRQNYNYLFNQMKNLNSENGYNLNLLSKIPKEYKIPKMEFKIEKTFTDQFNQVKEMMEKLIEGVRRNINVTFSSRSEEFNELKTLNGHYHMVVSVVELKDGKLASASGNDSIKIWDSQSGEWILQLIGHTKKVNFLATLDDGNLASGSSDYTIKIWDCLSIDCIKTLKKHKDEVTCLSALKEGKLASASEDRTIKIWDIQSGVCINSFALDYDFAFCLIPLGDDKLISGSEDTTIRIWDFNHGTCLMSLNGHSDTVGRLVLLNDEKLASASCDRTIKIWDIINAVCIMTLEGHENKVYCLALLSDGRLASGSEDNTIKIWDCESGDCIKTLTGHTKKVFTLTLLSNGNLISGSEDTSIKIWGEKRNLI